MKRILKALPIAALICFAVAGFVTMAYIVFESRSESAEYGAGSSPTGAVIYSMVEEITGACGKMDSYGGAYEYRDEDRHVCIVLLKDPENEDDKRKILDLTEHDDLVVFEKCEYSMEYLLKLQRKVNRKVFWNAFTTGSISEGAFNIRGNYIGVNYYNRKESTLKLLNKLPALDTEGGGDAIKIRYVLRTSTF